MTSYRLIVLNDYARKIPDARIEATRRVEGTKKTIRVISHALYRMGLNRAEAIRLIHEWNDQLDWSWSDRSIKRFVDYVLSNHKSI